jgi:hypothetical protein
MAALIGVHKYHTKTAEALAFEPPDPRWQDYDSWSSRRRAIRNRRHFTVAPRENHQFASIAFLVVLLSELIDADDNNLMKPLSCSGHSVPHSRASLIQIKRDKKGVRTFDREL